MAIIQTQTTSFKAELYQAIHNLSTDTIKIAMYTGNASLDASTTVYTTLNEVVASGYSAGGNTLTGVAISSSGYTAYVNWANTSWTGAITARCALIYNASKANRSIAIIDFGSDKSSTTSALIRSSN
jgi:hypothetical protein